LAAVLSLALALACADQFLTDPDGAGRTGTAPPATLAGDLSAMTLAGDPGCTDEDCPPDPGCTDEDCPPDPGCTDEDCPPDPGCTDEDCPPDPGCTDEDCPPDPGCTDEDCPPDPGCTDEDCTTPPDCSEGECTADNLILIDIKPGSYPNSWGCKAVDGAVPVAVLSTEAFDATTVDGNTVRFGVTGMEATPANLDSDGNVRLQVEDVDGDGLEDLVFRFRFGETGFSCEDIPEGSGETFLLGWLVAATLDEEGVWGVDEIRLVR